MPEQPLDAPGMTPLGALIRAAIAKNGGHANGCIFPDKCASLGNRAFAWIKFNLNELKLLTLNFKINIIGNACIAAVVPRA